MSFAHFTPLSGNFACQKWRRLFYVLRCFYILGRKNRAVYVMQCIEDTNESRLVCQTTRQDRHRTMMRIVRMLDRHAIGISGPMLVQGAQDPDPVDRRFKPSAWAVFFHHPSLVPCFGDPQVPVVQDQRRLILDVLLTIHGPGQLRDWFQAGAFACSFRPQSRLARASARITPPRASSLCSRRGCPSRIFTASMAFALISGAWFCLSPPRRTQPLPTPQASRDGTDRPFAPPSPGFDAGGFPPAPPVYYRACLSATRTGLAPAGDNALATGVYPEERRDQAPP